MLRAAINHVQFAARGRAAMSRRWGIHVLFVILGGILASVGLELFLVPNQIVVGGMTGITALLSHVTEMRIGLLLFVFNVPFIFLAYRHIRMEFTLMTLLGLFIFSLSAIILHPVPALIENSLSAALCGGVCLGLGIGLVVRFGGTLDTLEMNERYLSTSRGLGSPENLIMIMNCMILTAAGFIFGWKQAMYSIIAYLLAFEMIHVSIRGLFPYRTLCIVSACGEEIEREVQRRFGKIDEPLELEVSNNSGPPEMGTKRLLEQTFGTPQFLIYTVHFLDVWRIKGLIRNIDPQASIAVGVGRPSQQSHSEKRNPQKIG
ncbi:YitT family protein [Paenibacillus agricola]|uniref:YitT family protein n=1 Tax=Paenibacillus agricola TaxID=2716264 RepID=A0ABX0J9Z3_9BACL|nr:YitT family protein [Paenibacillus agricola]NHN32403.1 YitT family protein [Paenibacillus agricola]